MSPCTGWRSSWKIASFSFLSVFTCLVKKSWLLRRDADISRIYLDGIAELPPDRVRDHFGVEAGRDFHVLQRCFLNDAARLMHFEEAGLFRFWDAGELAEMVKKAGFRNVRSERTFGTPPQAVVVSADRA